MVPTSHLLAYCITALVLVAVPGPGVLFVVARSLTPDRAAGHIPEQLLILGGIFFVIALVSDAMWAWPPAPRATGCCDGRNDWPDRG
jgi:threonine/homoserine/homoserine lactone efflux protein